MYAYTYEEWCRATRKRPAPQECVACFCDGGIECPTCGNEVPCEECDGSGTIDPVREEYDEQHYHDQRRLAEFRHPEGESARGG